MLRALYSYRPAPYSHRIRTGLKLSSRLGVNQTQTRQIRFLTPIYLLNDTIMANYDTVTQAMESLSERGYTHQFEAKKDHLKEQNSDTQFKGDDFLVDEFHRFEGTSDPGDEMTVYAITTNNGTKGVFVMAQGTYADVSPDLMAKFNVGERPTVNTDGAVQPIDPSAAN